MQKNLKYEYRIVTEQTRILTDVITPIKKFIFVKNNEMREIPLFI